jgi:hypothetical protein
VERQGGSWSTLSGLRAAQEGDIDGRGLVHGDDRSKKDGGRRTERCWRATFEGSETGKQVSRDEWITHYETAGAEAARATNASRPKRAFGIGERILET